MKISTKGRYGLRTLMDIARHQESGAVTLHEIAARQKISVKYLWQVINPLKTAGLLRVTRGAKGGYTLARAPEQITLFEVISTLEGSLSPVECLENKAYCDQQSVCVAQSVWLDVYQAIEKTLKGITLETILTRQRETTQVNNYSI